MMFSSILMALPLVDFEHVILGNIKAPAHFLVVLTPSALERCDEPADWLRREIETALDIPAQYCAPHAGRLPASASFYPHLLDRASWQPVIGIREYREQLLIARYRGARYSQRMWSRNWRCFWARRFMFSGPLQLPYRNNRCAVRACPRRIKMEAARHYNNPLAACPVSFVDGT
jgi:hypothetical protein